MEDSSIIELFFSRSEQAIAELDRKYGGMCRKVAFHILNSREDVEECVNDVFLGVWNTIPPQRPDPLVTYVCRITRNLSLKRYRYNTAQRRNSVYDVSLSELEDCIPAADRGSETCTEEVLTDMIEGFLDSLDKRSRLLFIKRYWFAEPVKAIAEELGMTENHAAVKLMRLREKLKIYLKKKGVTV